MVLERGLELESLQCTFKLSVDQQLKGLVFMTISG